MPLFDHNPIHARVADVAGLRSVHAAFHWIHHHPSTIFDWQTELVAIPAPPFGEAARSVWIAEKFRQLGLVDVETDEIGNVSALLPAPHLHPESSGPVVLISAHLDTVFPIETPLTIRIDGERIEAPGVTDNGAGVVGLLAIAAALVEARAELPAPLVFIANVGEEGEGDLRGVRHFYKTSRYRTRVAAHVVLDGAGAEAAVTRALGSRRFVVTIHGPGGHSFSDAGTPNPIAALSHAIATLDRIELPAEPRTTMNFGIQRGGTSVNSIPEFAEVSVDFRSTSADELTRLEVALFRAVEDAVLDANRRSRPLDPARSLRSVIRTIGNRPAAELPADSLLLATLRSVDRHLGLRTEVMLGSTDANIPLSLGVPALSLGAGGDGGGAHTQAEWFDARQRTLGLRRVLLLTLAMVSWAAEQ